MASRQSSWEVDDGGLDEEEGSGGNRGGSIARRQGEHESPQQPHRDQFRDGGPSDGFTAAWNSSVHVAPTAFPSDSDYIAWASMMLECAAQQASEAPSTTSPQECEWENPFDPTPINPSLEQELQRHQQEQNIFDPTRPTAGTRMVRALPMPPILAKHPSHSHRFQTTEHVPLHQQQQQQQQFTNHRLREEEVKLGSRSIMPSVEVGNRSDHWDPSRDKKRSAKIFTQSLDLPAFGSSNAMKDQDERNDAAISKQQTVEPMNKSALSTTNPNSNLLEATAATGAAATVPNANGLPCGSIPSLSLQRLHELMAKSAASQKQLQEWDQQQGLPKCHSWTMMHTSRSRRQIQEGRVLPKWNGKPLIGDKNDDEGDDMDNGSKSCPKRKKETTEHEKSGVVINKKLRQTENDP